MNLIQKKISSLCLLLSFLLLI